MYKKTYLSFKVIARTKLVSFAILAALFPLLAFQKQFSSTKLSNNCITPILAKDAILKREQLCALYYA